MRYVGYFSVAPQVVGSVEIGIQALSLHEATGIAHEIGRKLNWTYIGTVEPA